MKQKGKKVRVTLYISKVLHEKMDEIIAKRMLAKKEKLTKSEIVEKALEKYLKELES
ncbi:hypothetical protein [Desulfurobacterium crinifex]